jgi:predicted amidohydrolase
MEITILQQNIVWSNPEANRKKADEAISRNPGSDLYVLPEMFSTGFATQPEGVAEEFVDGTCSSLEWMKRMAAELDAAIVGSIALKEDAGKFYNRLCFVRPDGECTFYDKYHLFTFGGEHLRYTAGDKRVVAEFRGFRFLLQICYDLRFPVFARNKADNAYDAAIYVASWPTPRVEAWLSLLKARAIENQCYVCAVNRVGTDPNCHYSGGTQLIDPYGKVVAECPMEEATEISGTLDKDMLEAFRQKFPVLHDADKF